MEKVNLCKQDIKLSLLLLIFFPQNPGSPAVFPQCLGHGCGGCGGVEAPAPLAAALPAPWLPAHM